MALKLMVSSDKANSPNVETVQYPGCETPLYMETSYIGCVISTRERNGYDDSDFYCTVWDESTQSGKTIEYGTTRAWTYPNNATVDATPEVLAKYRAWKIESSLKYAISTEEKLCRIPQAGRTCKVVKGRKYPKGIIVSVLDTYETCYGVGRWATRTTMAKIKYTRLDDARMDFGATNVENLEVVNPDQYKRSEAELRAMVTQCVDSGTTYMSPLLAKALSRTNY